MFATGSKFHPREEDSEAQAKYTTSSSDTSCHYSNPQSRASSSQGTSAAQICASENFPKDKGM